MVRNKLFEKIVCMDYDGKELWSQYWYRIDRLCANERINVASEDPSLPKELKEADCLLVKLGAKVGKELIDKALKLKYIGMLGTGIGGVDVQYAATKKIVVKNIVDYATEGVAEITFGMLFDQIRDIERSKQQAREGNYSGDTFGGTEIKGKNFGVIGLGHIGARIAHIAREFGANVKYWSKNRKYEEEKEGIEYQELPELLQNSDFITLNLSLNQSTEGFLDAERIAIIKKGAIVVNPSPMELVDFDALIRRLGKNDITFILDHSDEMEEKKLDLLRLYSNCVIHLPIGFTTEEAFAVKQGRFVENMESFLLEYHDEKKEK